MIFSRHISRSFSRRHEILSPLVGFGQPFSMHAKGLAAEPPSDGRRARHYAARPADSRASRHFRQATYCHADDSLAAARAAFSYIQFSLMMAVIARFRCTIAFDGFSGLRQFNTTTSLLSSCLLSPARRRQLLAAGDNHGQRHAKEDSSRRRIMDIMTQAHSITSMALHARRSGVRAE